MAPVWPKNLTMQNYPLYIIQAVDVGCVSFLCLLIMVQLTRLCSRLVIVYNYPCLVDVGCVSAVINSLFSLCSIIFSVSDLKLLCRGSV